MINLQFATADLANPLLLSVFGSVATTTTITILAVISFLTETSFSRKQVVKVRRVQRVSREPRSSDSITFRKSGPFLRDFVQDP